MTDDQREIVERRIQRAIEDRIAREELQSVRADDLDTESMAADIAADLGLEVVAHLEVRHAPGYSDDGASFFIKEADVYEGRRPINGFGAWRECEPLYRLAPQFGRHSA